MLITILDAVTRFKIDISILSTKITNLTNTKDSIEKFYQGELKNCLGKIEEKNEKIDELISK